jgi:hypothetical protein
MDRRKGGDWAPLSALPETDPEEDAAPVMRRSCDGETFELRPERSGGTHCTRLSGPNPGYGFTTSPIIEVTGVTTSSREKPDIEQHRTSIRNSLSMIDPESGYIEGD